MFLLMNARRHLYFTIIPVNFDGLKKPKCNKVLSKCKFFKSVLLKVLFHTSCISRVSIYFWQTYSSFKKRHKIYLSENSQEDININLHLLGGEWKVLRHHVSMIGFSNLSIIFIESFKLFYNEGFIDVLIFFLNKHLAWHLLIFTCYNVFINRISFTI